MKLSLTKKELESIDTKDLEKLKQKISNELSKRTLGRNNPSKDHLYTILITESERSRHGREGML